MCSLQMYSGALLATAARLAWDPSTYTWFRFLCAAQYRVSAAYVLAAGLWLAALVYVAAAATAQAHLHQRASRHPQRLHNTTCLHLVSGVVESTVILLVTQLYSRSRVSSRSSSRTKHATAYHIKFCFNKKIWPIDHVLLTH